MAESESSIVGFDLKEVFEGATSHVRGMAANLTKQQALDFYGLYKQATEGPCTKPKPSWYELTEKQKWEAWSSLGPMDPDVAMAKYVDLLTSLVPDWREKEPDKPLSWVHHSCMRNDEEVIEDSAKTVFDWVKETNAAMVRSSSEGVDVNKLDESGMGLLHWAADRGSLDIVRYLIESRGAHVDLRDENGQTPLHFAVSCDHSDVAEYLVQAGADVNVKDNDGLSPYETMS